MKNKIIAVGGMIASGKTTISEAITTLVKSKPLYELSNNDELQDFLLKAMYERRPDADKVFQLFFMLKRFRQYKEILGELKENEYAVLDRTVLEDRLFAKQNMLDEPHVFEYYNKMWKDKLDDLFHTYGKPILYIIMDIDWETFKIRLFQRNRKVEIDNFYANEQYFKKLNSLYVEYLVNVCKEYNIDYVLLDSKLSHNEQKAILLECFKSRHII